MSGPKRTCVFCGDADSGLCRLDIRAANASCHTVDANRNVRKGGHTGNVCIGRSAVGVSRYGGAFDRIAARSDCDADGAGIDGIIPGVAVRTV